MTENIYNKGPQPDEGTGKNGSTNHNGYHAENHEPLNGISHNISPKNEIFQMKPESKKSQQDQPETLSPDEPTTPTQGLSKVLEVKRRQLIKAYWHSEINEGKIAENKRVGWVKTRSLIKNTIILDNAKKCVDRLTIGEAENKLGYEYVTVANKIIEKTDKKMDELNQKMDAGNLKPAEANELYQDATKELLRFKNLKNISQLRETVRELSDVYELAGYTSDEAKKLARNTKISAALTIPSLWGSTALSGIVAYNAWNEGINFMANQDYSVQVSAAVAAHASLFYANHKVSQSNKRLFEATHFCPEVQVLGAHAISNKMLKDKKLAQGAVNHLSHWMPRLVEEVPWLSLNIANPEAALPANLAATAVVGGRYAAQTGFAKFAERRNMKNTAIKQSGEILQTAQTLMNTQKALYSLLDDYTKNDVEDGKSSTNIADEKTKQVGSLNGVIETLLQDTIEPLTKTQRSALHLDINMGSQEYKDVIDTLDQIKNHPSVKNSTEAQSHISKFISDIEKKAKEKK